MKPGPTLRLHRIESNSYATYGQLVTADEKEIAVTLEPPSRHNEQNRSCIPAGTYTAIRYRSPKRGYDVFLLTGVPGHEYIEIHIGNTADETHGCILLGDTWGTIATEAGNEAGIVRSKPAFDRFMRLLAGVSYFSLTIEDVSK